ncbi:MAG: ribbon-helix-helix protein, CopG family [Thermoanaerobaculia bacterium]
MAVATRTVRLDDDSEEILEKLVEATGLSTSGVLKQGLRALRDRLEAEKPVRTAFEIYQELDLGPGGYAIAPSDQVREGVLAAIRRKHGR